MIAYRYASTFVREDFDRDNVANQADTLHAPFQRAPNAGADLRMAPPDLVEHRNSPNAGSRLQDRHDLAVPNLGQWVRTPAATRRFLMRGQPRIILDAVAGCPATADHPRCGSRLPG